MNRLIEIAAAALASGSAAHRFGVVAQRSIVSVACAAAAVVLGVAAIGCGIAALWLYAAAALGPVDAALICAGVLLAAAILLLVVARNFVRRHRRAPAPAAAPGLDLGNLARLMSEHKGAVLIAAAILGMLAGSEERRPRS